LLLAGPIGIFAARAPRGDEIVYGLCLLASLLIAGEALAWLLHPGAAVARATLPFGLPWLEAHFRLDALSAYFLLLLNLLAAIVALFAMGYGAHEPEPARVLPFYPLFIAGMNLVLLSDDAFSFLLAWEFMSVTSWLLVMASHREPDTAAAGYLYLVMAGIGGMALLLAFGVLAGIAGDYSFDSIRHAGHGQAALAAAVLLVLLGAGSKAGLVPLHAWLPAASADGSVPGAVMLALLANVPLLIIARLPIDPRWLLLFGLVSLFAGAVALFVPIDRRRGIAVAAVAQLGIVVFAIGLGTRQVAWLYAVLLTLARSAVLQSHGDDRIAWFSFALLPLYMLCLLAAFAVDVSAWLLAPLGVGVLLLVSGLLRRSPGGPGPEWCVAAPIWLQLAALALLVFVLPARLVVR